MRILHYKRIWWNKPFGIHKNTCSCTGGKCGKTPRTIGYTILLWHHVFGIVFDKPKGCDAPF